MSLFYITEVSSPTRYDTSVNMRIHPEQSVTITPATHKYLSFLYFGIFAVWVIQDNNNKKISRDENISLGPSHLYVNHTMCAHPRPVERAKATLFALESKNWSLFAPHVLTPLVHDIDHSFALCTMVRACSGWSMRNVMARPNTACFGFYNVSWLRNCRDLRCSQKGSDVYRVHDADDRRL